MKVKVIDMKGVGCQRIKHMRHIHNNKLLHDSLKEYWDRTKRKE